MLLIKNGRVVDPASRTDAAMDVLLDGERIARLRRRENWRRSEGMRKSSMPPV